MFGLRLRRLHPILVASVVALGLAAASPSSAKEDDEGIPVEVRVLDASGNPIATAVVRHPDEEERHRVNTVTGSWVGNILYMPDGTMLKFEKGMELVFEVSAPGFITETVRYVVRSRKNLIEVSLEAMPIDEEESTDDPIIGFGRDKPIE
jgi:hypothetical protein